MKTTILKSAMVLATATLFTACGGGSGSDDGYKYVAPSSSSSNSDKLTVKPYSSGSGFTIKWQKAKDQYSEISYDYYANYKRGRYFVTSNVKGNYTVNCSESWHDSSQITFNCSTNSPNAKSFKSVILEASQTYHFYVNTGSSLTKGSTQFTIKYDGNGNITVK